MFTESVALKGKVNIIHLDQFGNTKDERNIDNLVVTTGKTFIASRMAGNTIPLMTKMGVGTNSTGAVIGDTSLGAAIAAGPLRVAAAVCRRYSCPSPTRQLTQTPHRAESQS